MARQFDAKGMGAAAYNGYEEGLEDKEAKDKRRQDLYQQAVGDLRVGPEQQAPSVGNAFGMTGAQPQQPSVTSAFNYQANPSRSHYAGRNPFRGQ